MPSKTVLPTAEEALPGRDEALKVAGKNGVNQFMNTVYMLRTHFNREHTVHQDK